jgi:hypothetical protein
MNFGSGQNASNSVAPATPHLQPQNIFSDPHGLSALLPQGVPNTSGTRNVSRQLPENCAKIGPGSKGFSSLQKSGLAINRPRSVLRWQKENSGPSAVKYSGSSRFMNVSVLSQPDIGGPTMITDFRLQSNLTISAVLSTALSRVPLSPRPAYAYKLQFRGKDLNPYQILE